jgi:DNA-binding response OmpR family regulator
MRALIVDDEPSILKLLTRILTRGGWNVCCAANDREALEAFKPAYFEIAFVDVNISDGLDGIILARRLRELDPALRIVMMSGEPANAARVEAAGLGTLLRKPFDLPLVDSLLLSIQGGKNVQ